MTIKVSKIHTAPHFKKINNNLSSKTTTMINILTEMFLCNRTKISFNCTACSFVEYAKIWSTPSLQKVKFYNSNVKDVEIWISTSRIDNKKNVCCIVRHCNKVNKYFLFRLKKSYCWSQVHIWSIHAQNDYWLPRLRLPRSRLCCYTRLRIKKNSYKINLPQRSLI